MTTASSSTYVIYTFTHTNNSGMSPEKPLTSSYKTGVLNDAPDSREQPDILKKGKNEGVQ